MRRVRQEGRVPHEERLVLLPLGDEIEDLLQSFPTDLQPEVTVPPSAFRIPVGHAVREATDLVVPLPPLSGLQAAVAKLAEDRRDGRILLEQIHHPLPVRPALRVVAGHAVPVRPSTRRERRETGATQRGRNVASREQRTLRRQSIEVRCANRLVTHEPVVAERLIVADDQHDVRSLSREARRREKENCQRGRLAQHGRPSVAVQTFAFPVTLPPPGR